MMFGVVVIYLQFVIYLFISKTDFYIKHSGCTEENKNSIGKHFNLYFVRLHTTIHFTLFLENSSLIGKSIQTKKHSAI